MQYAVAELNNFFGSAALATYAGGAVSVKQKSTGFNEQEFRQGDWRYRDSFVGYFKSFGREVVWYKDKPVWTQHYGGGMEAEYKENQEFTTKTFKFLKQALSAGEKRSVFQPRGPKEFSKGDWVYRSGFTGTMAKFSGTEEVLYKNKRVFTHHYFGGAVVDK